MKKFQHGDVISTSETSHYKNLIVLEIEGILYVIGMNTFKHLGLFKGLSIINIVNGGYGARKLENITEYYNFKFDYKLKKNQIKKYDFLKKLGHRYTGDDNSVVMFNINQNIISCRVINNFNFMFYSGLNINFDQVNYLRNLNGLPLVVHLPVVYEYADTIELYERIGFNKVDFYHNGNSNNRINVYIYD